MGSLMHMQTSVLRREVHVHESNSTIFICFACLLIWNKSKKKEHASFLKSFIVQVSKETVTGVVCLVKVPEKGEGSPIHLKSHFHAVPFQFLYDKNSDFECINVMQPVHYRKPLKTRDRLFKTNAVSLMNVSLNFQI